MKAVGRFVNLAQSGIAAGDFESALDVALSDPPVDSAAVRAAAAKVDATCQRCHTAFRDEDAASKTFFVKERR
jgi:cytochrome c556